MIAYRLRRLICWRASMMVLIVLIFFASKQAGADAISVVVVIGSISAAALMTIGVSRLRERSQFFDFAMTQGGTLVNFTIAALAAGEFLVHAYAAALASFVITAGLAFSAVEMHRRASETRLKEKMAEWKPGRVRAVLVALGLYEFVPVVGMGLFLINGTLLWLLAPVLSLVIAAVIASYCARQID